MWCCGPRATKSVRYEEPHRAAVSRGSPTVAPQGPDTACSLSAKNMRNNGDIHCKPKAKCRDSFQLSTELLDVVAVTPRAYFWGKKEWASSEAHGARWAQLCIWNRASYEARGVPRDLPLKHRRSEGYLKRLKCSHFGFGTRETGTDLLIAQKWQIVMWLLWNVKCEIDLMHCAKFV